MKKLEENGYRWTKNDIIQRTEYLGKKIYKITKQLV